MFDLSSLNNKKQNLIEQFYQLKLHNLQVYGSLFYKLYPYNQAHTPNLFANIFNYHLCKFV